MRKQHPLTGPANGFQKIGGACRSSPIEQKPNNDGRSVHLCYALFLRYGVAFHDLLMAACCESIRFVFFYSRRVCPP